jgi:anti-anti-sigma factor
VDETPYDTLYFAESSTLMVLGCVDELHVDAFREAVREASLDHHRDLVVDLTEAEFIPSIAIGVLVGATKACRANGATLRLEARSGTIARRVLDICGMPAAEPRVGPDPAPA